MTSILISLSSPKRRKSFVLFFFVYFIRTGSRLLCFLDFFPSLLCIFHSFRIGFHRITFDQLNDCLEKKSQKNDKRPSTRWYASREVAMRFHNEKKNSTHSWCHTTWPSNRSAFWEQFKRMCANRRIVRLDAMM